MNNRTVLRRGLGNVILNAGAGGTVQVLADLANIPTPGHPIPSGVPGTPGQRLFAQYWYRDTASGAPTSNLSNGLLFVLAP